MNEQQADIDSRSASRDAESNRPSLLWMARSFLFRGQLTQSVEAPNGANWYTRLAINFENPPNRYNNLICDVIYTIDFVAFAVLFAADHILLKIIGATIAVTLTVWLVSMNIIWAWHGGWRFMKEDGWGWKPECVAYRRARRPIRRK